MQFGVREILFFTLMLGVLVASWWFGFQRVDQRREQLREQMALKQAELAKLQEATSHVEDLAVRIDDLQQALDFFESRLPRASEVDRILRDVWEAAERNRLEIRRFETLRSERDAYWSEQPIRIELTGDFDGFYEYLLQLEQLRRITRVTNMKLRRIQERNGAMEAEIVLSIFFEPTSAGQDSMARR